MRVARMPIAKTAQQRQRVLWLLLVPEIDQMELVVGLVSQDLSAVAGAQHLVHPGGPVTARQREEEAENLGRGRRDSGVVVIQAEPK